MINFNPIKSSYKIHSSPKLKTPLSFLGTELCCDTFEKGSGKRFIRVFNPYSNSFCNDSLDIDLSKPQVFELKNNEKNFYKNSSLTVYYNPKRIGYLHDKTNNSTLKTAIVFSKLKEEDYAFNFMSEDLNKSYGYVDFTKLKIPEFSFYYGYRDEMVRNWVEEGIVGERIIVNYLKNFDEKKIGGIGKLSDKMLVKFCLDNNMQPNIVAEADSGSHVAHYLRGRRFFELESTSLGYNFFMSKYGTADINKILEKLIKESKLTGIPVNLCGWGVAAMYMPKKIVEKYISELAAHPIP